MGVSNINTGISQCQQVIYLLCMLINIVGESRGQSVRNATEPWALFAIFTALCPEKWKLLGVAQWSVRFKVTHSDAHCPVPESNDVMFHLRLLAMLKALGALGKRQWESCESGFCKAFVFRVLIDKSWLMQYFWRRSCRTSKCFSFYLSARWGNLGTAEGRACIYSPLHR